jgi:formylglycine-generating enzyme required for sulfatase activity
MVPAEVEPAAPAADVSPPALLIEQPVESTQPRPINRPGPAGPASSPAHDRATLDPLLRLAIDQDAAVAGLVLDTLLNMGETVKNYVMLLSLQPRSTLHRGGEAYLSYLLGEPVVYIPLGPFLMGSDPAVDELAELNEQPQHQVSLAGYWLGRYPVTSGRFQTFVQKSGFRPAKVEFKSGYENYPVGNVSWAEALAYCHWLSEQSGLEVTLPSEAEWEKGARGADGRRYPWGNQRPTAEFVNFDGPTPVGSYSPQADSPYGCADMAGNVWEWTRSAYRAYPYDPSDGREELSGKQTRVVRGLTFNNPPRLTRCSYRYRLQPQFSLPSLGFRIAVRPR